MLHRYDSGRRFVIGQEQAIGITPALSFQQIAQALHSDPVTVRKIYIMGMTKLARSGRLLEIYRQFEQERAGRERRIPTPYARTVNRFAADTPASKMEPTQ